MCGRYTLSHPGEMLEQLAVVDALDHELEPRYNIAPTQSVPAVRADGDGARRLVALRWGLVPFWADDLAIGNRMINARSETAASKPAFRAAFARRRCLLLADGFFEWVARERGPKQPFHIHRPDRTPFAFAGLWERWDKGEAAVESCTILTTAASEAMTPYHHRMPVVLEGAARDRWLSDDADRSELESLAGPFTGELTFTPVSRLVNNPRNDVPRCIEPLLGDA
ncbi:MAG: SOS response-associated peptidase [Acidobacteriota bacterium]